MSAQRSVKDGGAIGARLAVVWVFAAIGLSGCTSMSPVDVSTGGLSQKTFPLNDITPEQAITILSALGCTTAAETAEPNTLSVRGSPGEIERAGIVLELVDCGEPFHVQTLAPVSLARTLPSNDRIAQAIGEIAIGTFAVPPEPGQSARAIIDVCGDEVVAIAPLRYWPQIRGVIELGPEARRVHTLSAQEPLEDQPVPEGEPAGRQNREPPATAASAPEPEPAPRVAEQPVIQAASFESPDEPPAARDHQRPPKALGDPRTSVRPSEPTLTPPTVMARPPDLPDIARGVLKPSGKADRPAPASSAAPTISFPNGDDVLELSLPEKIELVQLIDLAGIHLNLDCIYEPEKIGNQVITLKLHSKLQSEMRVKDLYSLLETVLKFKGLAMVRCGGNLVTIVPAAEALAIDPQLVDPNNRSLQAGDVVVTRVFELRHVDAASVMNLLQNMKLSVAVSPIPETQTLFVTCYAHRMARIEQLVEMVDRPGRPREFRFRQLRYTMASTLARKVIALAQELEGIAVTVGSTETDGRAGRSPQPPAAAQRSAANPAVYLDTDERTNRILMIGPAEPLETVEGLIDTLDVPQQDLRMIEVYGITCVTARAVLDKLTQLEIVGRTDPAAARAAKAPAGAATADAPSEQPQVVLLEATNSLLVNATVEQHGQIRRIIDHIDISPQDQRTLKTYRIRYADAEDAANKLQQLQAVGQVALSAKPLRAAQSGQAAATPAVLTSSSDSLMADAPQVVVLEAANSLLVNATAQQHDRVRAILEHIDTEVPRETVPYEIYFLENQDPEQMAGVLGKLIQETVTNAEGKVERTLARTDEPVTIIADKSTFSLIVHASRKNQDWIGGLIQKLDKRRPQVLIDVTLVEITEAEAFNYDLNLIQSFPDLTATSGLTGTIVPGQNGVTSGDILNRLDAAGRDRFVDYQATGGELRAFYGDRHINVLLQAMQSKNYGRILAKPKILVNDNEPGTIKTADTTYVVKRASIPVGSGAAGNDVTLIETAVDYEPYEAGITLNITPHISQGELLRLDIELTRSDFRETEDSEKPPDTTASELKTTVFTPDGSTIILGGLLKLNQNKGGTKVPILGDLPIVGGLFRTINNRDLQSKLYIFVKAEIIRPAGVLTQGMEDLEAISEANRQAFERHEQKFQNYQSWPGAKPKPVDPVRVLQAR